MKLDKLDRFLFKCADIIRNTVDKTDYKDYILPLFFYKIVSDTYQDRYEEKLEKYADPDVARDPAFHDFQIPEGYLWSDLRNQTENIDQFINEAFEKIEKENPEKLSGVFRADYVAAESLSDSILKELIEHLSSHNLSKEKIDPDTLGHAYMDLVKHFAQEEGRSGGEYFTPPRIVELIIKLLNPHEKGASIYDPTCGSAGMLIEAAEHFKNKNIDPTTLRLYGQELNPDIYAIAKMNMFIHDLNGEIEREDTLRNPQYKDNSSLKQFDYVVANFPFSVKNWGKEELKDDKYNRFEYGLPPKNRGDYAFIQHMLKSLNETGRMGVVVPHGVLFRSRSEQTIRKGIIEDDYLEAVIGLPENLFQNNSIPCAIMIFNKEKPKQRKNKIQFIHAADQKTHKDNTKIYREQSNQNKLTKQGIEKITDTFRKWKTIEKHSRTVELKEIKENDYNLNIALYVDTTEPQENIDVTKELQKLKKLQQERQKIEKQMMEHMEALNYEQ